MAPTARCIYCSNTFLPAQGEGDHVIPSQLGEFRDDSRFRGLCRACNSVIGRAEQQMVQSGPEGFFRQIISPRSKRLNWRGIGRPRGEMGAPPPTYIVNMNDDLRLVEPTSDPQIVNAVDHIMVRDNSGNRTHVRLYPGIRGEQVRKQLEQLGIGELKEARLHCSDDNWPEYMSLLKNLWPDFKVEEGDATPAGLHPQIPGTVHFVVNVHYFQAVAKIAFHYFLSHSRRGFKGDEEHFTSIRNFIINGGSSPPRQ